MRHEIFQLLNERAWVHGWSRNVPEVGTLLRKCADACFDINNMRPSQREEREARFRELLGSAGERFVIHSPFRCDFGFNIHIGTGFVGNFNLCILDEAEVRIGDNVLIGPNCSLVTINHAVDSQQRNDGVMQAKPIEIGDNVWIGANVVVLPGVSIGSGAVIGAGSVVTKSIPAGMVAVGNPCRPVRAVTEADRVSTVI